MKETDVFNFGGPVKLASIDAMRGWAIFMVITAHTAGAFAELPWPVKKLTNMGWYGVQLFFIASAFTLLMSWQRQQGVYWKKTTKFFIRRFFRIVPMYYFGCLLYFIIRPPLEKFNFEQLFATMGFLNSWSPKYMTTVIGGWQVVPGGWSIGVEFSFYFVFPILILIITSLSRSIKLFIFGLGLSFISYFFGMEYYMDFYEEEASSQFLFFWLPNQLGIFAIGFILFYISHSDHEILKSIKLFMCDKAFVFFFLCLVILVSYSQIGINKHYSFLFPWIPAHYNISFVFFVFSLIILQKEFYFLVNPYITSLGQVSFSAYIIHFSVIQLFSHMDIIGTNGVESIAYFSLLLVFVIGITFFVSKITYYAIEEPFMKLGKKVCKYVG